MNVGKSLAALSMVAIVAGAPRPVLAQSAQWDALFDRIIRLEARIKSLQAKPERPVTNLPPTTEGARVARLENQVRLLSSQLRDMTQRLERLQRRLDALAASDRQGFRAAPRPDQTGGDGAPRRLTPTERLNQAQLNPDVSTTFNVNTLPQAGTGFSEEVVIGDNASASAALPPTGTGSVTGSALPEPVQTSSLDGGAATGLPGGTAGDAMFKNAYRNLLRRRLGLAESGFKTFLRTSPRHRKAAEARYWLGETYYQQGRNKLAAQNYLQSYRLAPNGAKGGDSLLMLGIALRRLGEKKQACVTLGEVGKRYPKAKALVNRSRRELKRAGC